jgi:hypothetical protein
LVCVSVLTHIQNLEVSAYSDGGVPVKRGDPYFGSKYEVIIVGIIIVVILEIKGETEFPQLEETYVKIKEMVEIPVEDPMIPQIQTGGFFPAYIPGGNYIKTGGPVKTHTPQVLGTQARHNHQGNAQNDQNFP